MLVKLSSEMLAIIGGANNAAEGADKLSAYLKTAKENATAMAENKSTQESFEASLKAMEERLSAKIDKVDSGISGKAESAISAWSASAEGKKIIGAEASRICMESLAAVGTQPAKPAPVGATDTTTTAKGLIAEGKFEEAYALDKDIRAEFPSAKHFATYARAEAEGRVSFSKSKN